MSTLKFAHRFTVQNFCIALALLVLAILLPLQGKPAHAESNAFVRVVHASPDIGTADVFLDGNKLLSNFQFGTITDYVSLPPGPHKVQVALIGRGSQASVITQNLTVQAGIAYTVAALGTKSQGFKLDVFVDNNQLDPGRAKIRVYHLSPGTGTVDVLNGGNAVVNGLGYEQASNYLTLSAGSYTFNVNVTQPATNQTVSATLKANTVTSVFAVGVFNSTPKLQFVSAQVTGLPGMPPTGSDPNTVIVEHTLPSQHFPWLTALLVCVLGFGASGLLALFRARTKLPGSR